METDPLTISAYLIYLSQNAPVEEQAAHNDLALVILLISSSVFVCVTSFVHSVHLLVWL